MKIKTDKEIANEALQEAIAHFKSMRALGAALTPPRTKGAIGQWKLPGRSIPAEACSQIEQLTNGKVLRARLNPNVFREASRK